jgi:DNA invertase Pin-like site-specific DNA recombinase
MASLMKELEAKQTAERTKDTLAEMQAKGRNISRPPYGWKKASSNKGSGLVEHPEQQIIITYIRQLYKEQESYKFVADKLNSKNVPSPGNGKNGWNGDSVKKIINRTDVKTKGRDDM